MRGGEIIKAWAEEVGSGDSGWVRAGYMMPADAARLPALEENVARLVSWGLDTRVVSFGEIAEIEPLLSLDGIAGGAYEPDGGFADAQKMTLSWLAAGLLHGVVPMVGARVTWIRVAGGGVRGLDTDRGPVRGGVVVDAAGGWGGALSRSAGVELPISPARAGGIRAPAGRPAAGAAHLLGHGLEPRPATGPRWDPARRGLPGRAAAGGGRRLRARDRRRLRVLVAER